MRISDWSSDVCSSDLGEGGRDRHHQDEDDEVKRGRHLMLAEEERRPGEVGDQLDEEEQQRKAAPFRAARVEDHREREAEADIEDRPHGGEDRSEEHTSELQSLMRNSYAVICLKKTNK